MTTPDDVLAAVRGKQQRDEAQVADLDPPRHRPAGGAQLRRRRHAPDLRLGRAAAQCRRRRRRPHPGRDLRRNDPGQHPHPAERRSGAGFARDVQDRRPAASPSRWCATETRTACGAAVVGRRRVRQPVLVERQQRAVVGRRHDGPHAEHGRARRLDRVGEAGAGTEGQVRAREDQTKAKPGEKKEQPAKQTANANPGAIRPKSEPAEIRAADRVDPAACRQVRARSMARQPTVPTGGFDNRFGAWR